MGVWPFWVENNIKPNNQSHMVSYRKSLCRRHVLCNTDFYIVQRCKQTCTKDNAALQQKEFDWPKGYYAAVYNWIECTPKWALNGRF